MKTTFKLRIGRHFLLKKPFSEIRFFNVEFFLFYLILSKRGFFVHGKQRWNAVTLRC